MKYLKALLSSILFLSTFLSLRAEDDSSILLGNSTNRSAYLISAGTAGAAGAALCYADATLAAFRGCSISGFRLDLYAPTGEDSLRLFVARSLDAEPLAEWVTTGVKKGWNTVTLDMPFTIPDDGPLVMGYEILGARYLRYADPLLPCEEYRRVNGGEWQPVKDAMRASFQAVLTGERLPERNVLLTWSRLPHYGWMGKDMRFEGTFVNLGTEVVEEFTVDVSLGDEVLHSEACSTDVVEPRGSGRFAFTVPTPYRDFLGKLTLAVTQVNGGDDASPGDNLSEVADFMCRKEDFTPRTILMEEFSTENCTNCPNVHKSVMLFAQDRTDIIEVIHHAGFLTDKLTVPESEEMLWFYPADKLYAPAVMFDRTNFADALPDIYADGTPVTGITLEGLKRQYAEAAEVPAFAALRLFVDPDVCARTMQVEVMGDMLLPFDDALGNLRLNVYVTEDSIASQTQRGASGTYHHRHALRKVLTPAWGDSVSDDCISGRYAVEIPDGWQFERLSVVAFLTAYDGHDANRSPVLAATECSVGDEIVGIYSPVSASGIPSPQCFYHPGGTFCIPSKAAVYDLSGRRVAGQAPRGVYIMK